MTRRSAPGRKSAKREGPWKPGDAKEGREGESSEEEETRSRRELTVVNDNIRPISSSGPTENKQVGCELKSSFKEGRKRTNVASRIV